MCVSCTIVCLKTLYRDSEWRNHYITMHLKAHSSAKKLFSDKMMTKHPKTSEF